MPGFVSRTVLVAFCANLVVAIAKSGAAVVTGSPSMTAEAAHSWADTGNEVFLVFADRRSRRTPDERHPLGHGREAWVWSLFAAIGIFTAGAVVSIAHGVSSLSHPQESGSFTVAWVVLALAAVLEGASFVQAAAQVRRKADRAQRGFRRHLMRTSNATLRAVFFEDGAALVGLAIAACGIALHQATGSELPDAVASIAIGILLGGVAYTLINSNRRFLVGEVADPDLRRDIEERICSAPAVEHVTSLHIEFIGPEEVLVVAAVDLAGDEPEHIAADRLARAVEHVEQGPLVRKAFLTLATRPRECHGRRG
jgi:cation diffusion facilitator family transporter